MEIILVRHCETDWNKQNRCQGISDISLNNDGLKQAEDLRFYFSDRNIDIMFTSPLKRAIETANIISTDKGLSIKYSEELREMDQGDFEGIPFNTLRDYYSSELKQWRENPENFRIPNGETLGEVRKRMISFVGNMVKNYPENLSVLVVSHNLALSTLLCSIKDKNLKSFTDFTVKSGSISTIDYSDKVFSLKNIDYIKHLKQI